MKSSFIFVSIISIIALLISCEKEKNIENEKSSTSLENYVEPSGITILGKKLENPYSVKNMRLAGETIRNKGIYQKTTSEIDTTITANQLYVRFLPSDTGELNILWNDSTLELFDHPLDYEILHQGLYYVDPSISEGGFQWLYTVVPVDYNFPDIEHEVLEECFIPRADSGSVGYKTSMQADYYTNLEYESLLLAGFIDSATYQLDKSTNALKENPEGYIKVSTTNNGRDTGVMRVKIRCYTGVNIASTWIGTNGHYRMPHGFLASPNYELIFENETSFKVWGNVASLNAAFYAMGNHSKNGHSRTLYTNSVAWLWSTVNNATYIFRTTICPQFGISSPPSGLRIWTTRTGGEYGGSAPMARQSGFRPDDIKEFLVAYSIGSNLAYINAVLPDIFVLQEYTTTTATYSTMFHELAHASHYEKAGNAYWTNYVAAIVSHGGYGEYGTGKYDGFIGVGEMWGNYFGALAYKSWFTKNWNELTLQEFNPKEDWYNPGFMKDVDENISDITTQEIYNCLISSTNTIKTLKSKFYEITQFDSQIDTYYSKADYNDWPN